MCSSGETFQGKAVNTWELYTRIRQRDQALQQRLHTACRPVHLPARGARGRPPSSGRVSRAAAVRVGIACVQHVHDLRARRHAPSRLDRHLPLHRHHRRPHTTDTPPARRAPSSPGATSAAMPPPGVARVRPTGAGIRAVQVRVDGGRVVGEDAAGVQLHAQSAVLGRFGTHERSRRHVEHRGRYARRRRSGSFDAGGNFTAATTQTITVDNGRARAAGGDVGHLLTTTAADQTAVLLGRAARPGVAHHDQAHITVCAASTCRTTSAARGPLGTGHATVGLFDGPGDVRGQRRAGRRCRQPQPLLRDSLVDHAHRAPRIDSDAEPAAPPGRRHRRRPSAAPGSASPAPRIAHDGRTITVRGTVAPTARGRVHLTIRTRIGGSASAGSRSTPRSRAAATPPCLKLPSRRWRTATRLTARHGGTTITRAIRPCTDACCSQH